MPVPATPRRPYRSAARSLAAAVTLAAAAAAVAQAVPSGSPAATSAPASDSAPASARSALDAALFYQLLIGELELSGGQPGNAYAVLIDAARRTRDESLFKRSVDVALQARAGDQALAAARAWRQTLPQSLEALRYELQLLTALNRSNEAAEPLKLLLARTPEAERGALAATLPRLFQRVPDKRQAAQMLEEVLQPYTADNHLPAARAGAHVALGRAWWLAADAPRALAQAERAQALDAAATGPVALALEMLGSVPEAHKVVANYLQRADADVAVQLAYVRVLSGAQRYVEAIAQLQQVTRKNPDMPGPWLTLGALQLELRQPRDAEAALQRFLTARAAAPLSAATAAMATASTDDDDNDDSRSNDGGQTQAWLMLSQALRDHTAGTTSSRVRPLALSPLDCRHFL